MRNKSKKEIVDFLIDSPHNLLYNEDKERLLNSSIEDLNRLVYETEKMENLENGYLYNQY